MGPKFSLLKITTFLLLLFWGFACGQRLPSEIDSTSTPKEILEMGDKSLSRGYYEQAGDYYSAVNKYFPYSIEDEIGLGKAVDAYYKANKLEEARMTATKFLTI